MGSEGTLHNGVGGKQEVVGIQLEKGRAPAAVRLKIQAWKSGNQRPRNTGCSWTGGLEQAGIGITILLLPQHIPGTFQGNSSISFYLIPFFPDLNPFPALSSLKKKGKTNRQIPSSQGLLVFPFFLFLVYFSFFFSSISIFLFPQRGRETF